MEVFYFKPGIPTDDLMENYHRRRTASIITALGPFNIKCDKPHHEDMHVGLSFDEELLPDAWARTDIKEACFFLRLDVSTLCKPS